MGGVFFGVPPELTERLRKGLHIRKFIETGTLKGETAEWAAGHFETVYTIEMMEDRWRSASERLANLRNISFLLGDSREILPGLMKELDEPALFWLDAHNPGDEALVKNTPDECPIIRELEIIAEYKRYEHVILIDDMRCFADNNRGKYWPSLEELDEKISDLFGKYYAIYHVQDVIIAIPLSGEGIVDNYVAELNNG